LTYAERVIFDHEIVLIVSGEGDLQFRDAVIPWEAHDVLFLRPFVPHTFVGRGNVDHIAIHFDFSPSRDSDLERRKPYAVQLAEGMELPTKQRTTAGGAVERSLAQVVEYFALRTPNDHLRARAEFLRALSVLLTREGHVRGQFERRRAQLTHTVAYMREHLAEPLSSTDLQRTSCLGPTQLHALFRELTGYSPVDYLRRLRIDSARELLSNPSLSIKEVASQTGFSDPNHFSRVFTRVDGVPPTAYREALLSNRRVRIGAAPATRKIRS
jgi:AraC-like DNA-binding protein